MRRLLLLLLFIVIIAAALHYLLPRPVTPPQSVGGPAAEAPIRGTPSPSTTLANKPPQEVPVPAAVAPSEPQPEQPAPEPQPEQPQPQPPESAPSVPSPAPEEPAPIETAPATITLASFNLLHLGWNNGKNLDDLAAILARYDIIALQEVMKKSGNDDDPLFDLKLVRDKVQALTASDGAPVWEFQVTSESLGRSTYREYYAILYRTDRVQYVGGASVFADEHDVFIREPFFATFRAGNFDFTLITMHAIGPGDPLLDAEISGLKKVFLSVQDGSACENDVLLVGDFNKPADKSAWAELRTIPTIRNLIPSTTKTSIGKSGMANAYDNIWIQDQHTDWEYSGNSGAYYYFNDLYADAANRYQRARTVLSDHVPVWAEFRTDLEDDDGPCP